VQPILTHDRVLSLAIEPPGGRRRPDLNTCDGRYTGFKKPAINFKKSFATLEPVPGIPATPPGTRTGIALGCRAARHRSRKYVSGNELCYVAGVAEWTFLTNHARVLLCVAHDPGARLRDIAASLGITERTAHGILGDLIKAGYVVKQRDGRRNRYQVQAHLPLREPVSREVAIGEVLALLLGSKDGHAGLVGPAMAPGLDGGPAAARSEG
jgi:hypothetical protein